MKQKNTYQISKGEVEVNSGLLPPNQNSREDYSYLISYTFIALVLLLLNLGFIYEKFLWVVTGFIYIVFLVIVSVFGLIKMLQNQFEQGTLHLTISIIFLVLLFSPVRLYELQARHYIKFILEKKRYESEVKNMGKNIPKYREWIWASSGIFLVYDESDRTLLTKYEEPCSTKVFKLESHFYVIDGSC